MNKILIGWGIDPKFADMFDETIIALLMVGLWTICARQSSLAV